MTSTLRTTHARCYLIAIVLLTGTMTVAQAAGDPADETDPIVMKTPMPAGHEMPGPAFIDPMPAASMDPAQPGKKMGSMAKMTGQKRMLKRSAPASVNPTLSASPGASHLYHVGATGFFLDLSPRIALTADQQGALNQMKAKTLFSKSASDRKIEAGEQDLWLLTAVDSPSAVKITAKVREIEKERGDERIAFIQAVGEAAKILTPAQQAQLFDSGPAVGAAGMAQATAPAALTTAPL